MTELSRDELDRLVKENRVLGTMDPEARTQLRDWRSSRVGAGWHRAHHAKATWRTVSTWSRRGDCASSRPTTRGMRSSWPRSGAVISSARWR